MDAIFILPLFVSNDALNRFNLTSLYNYLYSGDEAKIKNVLSIK